MTKARDPGSVHYAIHLCVGTLKAEVERVTGKSERYLRMCADPDEDRHIQLRDAVALDKAMREAGHGEPILAAYRALVEAVPSGRATGCPVRAALGIGQLLAPVFDIVTSAMEDGVLDASERRDITRAAHALIEQANKLVEIVNAAAPVSGDAAIPFRGRAS